MIRKAFFLVIFAAIMLSLVGVAYSYESTTQSSNTFGSDYCTISTTVDDGYVEDVKVITGIHEETYYLGFSSDGTNYQETLLLDYYNTMGTNLVLSISFSCTTTSETPIIGCMLDEAIIGSTLLTGDSTKKGTISGIVLPLNENTNGSVVLSFLVDGIDLDTSVEISFYVYPLEVFS